jgi:hypothetical protein
LKDGKKEVYVCVELASDGLDGIGKKLSQDKKLSIDFAEHNFMQEMEKERQAYVESQK